MSYHATVFNEEFPGGKKSAEVHIFHGDRLIARHDSGSLEVDLNVAEFTPGGFDNNMLYIYPDSSNKSIALLIQDISLLAELEGSSNAVVRNKAALALNRRKRKKINRASGIIITVALFVGLILLASTRAADLIVNLMPVKWDEKLGEIAYPSAIQAIAPGNVKIEDKYILESMDEIKNRLEKALVKSPFKYNVTILKSPVENAFALPGGKIVILTGIIQKVDSAEELAGILAHEIMHVEKRHAMRQMISQLGLFTLFQLVLGNSADAGSVILEMGTELLSLGYSRSMETEADYEGIKLLSSAQVPADGMIRFFEKMSENEKELQSMQWLLTHPLSKKRAEELTKVYNNHKPEKIKKFSSNWNIIKSRLK